MPTPTRRDLEDAAVGHFAGLAAEMDGPRSFNEDHFSDELEWNIECSRVRSAELDGQLKQNVFDKKVQAAAAEIAEAVGVSFDELEGKQKLFACHLAARAEREKMQLLIHQLSNPHRQYKADDELFSRDSAQGSSREVRPRVQHEHPQISLGRAVRGFVQRMEDRNLSQSQIVEVTRALAWLTERLGESRPATSVTKSELRTFRDDISRLDVTLRGRRLPLERRLTNQRDRQIKSATALRYWRSVRSFFAWCTSEQFLDEDPSSGLKLDARKGELKRTPEPFTPEELQGLFRTPLYAGFLSPKRVLNEGQCRRREGHWWSGVLLMFTGLRAGELCQLLPEDFDFNSEVPHLKIRELDAEGLRTKSAKNEASIRDVPLAPALLSLGLREFVQMRSAISPKARIFREFRLGTQGRKSDGLTKFWSKYLRNFGLWKEGRSTHVWRHTVVACLRANDVAEEDIAAFVGHATGTMTSRYGGAYPLSRKFRTAERLDYAFDVISALGGQYVKDLHS